MVGIEVSGVKFCNLFSDLLLRYDGQTSALVRESTNRVIAHPLKA